MSLVRVYKCLYSYTCLHFVIFCTYEFKLSIIELYLYIYVLILFIQYNHNEIPQFTCKRAIQYRLSSLGCNSRTKFSKSLGGWIWEFVGNLFENKDRSIGNQNGIAKASNAVRLLCLFPTHSRCVHSPKKAPLKHLLQSHLLQLVLSRTSPKLKMCDSERLAMPFVLAKNLTENAVWQWDYP